LSTINPAWIAVGLNPGLSGEKPATNRLSCGVSSGSGFGVRLFWYTEETSEMSGRKCEKRKLREEMGGEGKRQENVNDEQRNYRTEERQINYFENIKEKK
jgi:hypothetical protein